MQSIHGFHALAAFTYILLTVSAHSTSQRRHTSSSPVLQGLYTCLDKYEKTHTAVDAYRHMKACHVHTMHTDTKADFSLPQPPCTPLLSDTLCLFHTGLYCFLLFLKTQNEVFFLMDWNSVEAIVTYIKTTQAWIDQLLGFSSANKIERRHQGQILEQLPEDKCFPPWLVWLMKGLKLLSH